MTDPESTTRGSRRRRLGGRALRWAVSLACLAVIVALVDVGEAWAIARRADPALLGAALAIALADRAVMIAKWFPLLRVQAPEVGPGLAARAYFAGGAAQVVVPTPVSGDVVRAVVIGRRGSGIPEIGASIVMERLLGIVGSGLACLAALLLAVGTLPRIAPVVPWVAAGVVLAVVALGISLRGGIAGRLGRAFVRRDGSRVATVLARFGAAYRRFSDRPALLAAVAAASAAEQFVPVLCLWALSRATGASATLLDLAIAVPLAMLVARLPVAVGGFGVGEGALVALLAAIGVPAAEGLAIGALGAVVTIAVAAPGVVFWPALARRGGEVAG